MAQVMKAYLREFRAIAESVVFAQHACESAPRHCSPAPRAERNASASGVERHERAGRAPLATRARESGGRAAPVAPRRLASCAAERRARAAKSTSRAAR